MKLEFVVHFMDNPEATNKEKNQCKFTIFITDSISEQAKTRPRLAKF